MHYQSHWLGNRCSILLGSPKRQSKICLLELCSWRTRGWSTYFLAPAPHWLRVVPGCIHSLTLADCDLCVDQAAPSELPCRGPKPCGKGDICGWNQSGPQVVDRTRHILLKEAEFEASTGRGASDAWDFVLCSLLSTCCVLLHSRHSVVLCWIN